MVQQLFSNKAHNSDDISGARIGSIFSNDARAIAVKLYDQFRRRDDCETVANNTGFSLEQIQMVKYYVFYAKHLNMMGDFERFIPSYDMAESWRRLSVKHPKQGIIKTHDILLIQHELLEMQLLISNSNITQMQAHNMANHTYNYQQASDNFYIQLGIRVR